MNLSFVRLVAAWGPWLAPIPSAFFIGRSIYLHLLSRWAGGILPPAANLAVASVAGVVVEMLAIVSIHNTLALYRWNQYGHVRKKDGWERAPVPLAVVCAGLYLATAILLLVVLEAVPWLAQYAPILFPLLAVVGAVNLVMLDQHEDRLERYGLSWELRRAPGQRLVSASPAPQAEEAAPLDALDLFPEALTCHRCGREFSLSAYEGAYHAEQALRGHLAHCKREAE